MNRYIRALAIGLAAASVGLAACGRTDTGTGDTATSGAEGSVNAQGSGTLVVWAMGAEGDQLPEFIQDFEKQNPDITVEVTPIPWDSAHDKLQAAIAAGNGPDVAQIGTTWMTDFAHAFDEVPEQIDTAGIFEGSLDTARVDGKLVGVPWYADTRVLYYRKDLASQAGWDTPPSTWEELYQMASDLQEKTDAEYGIRLPGSEFDSFQGSLWMLWSAGGELMSDDGSKWTINTPEAKEAYEYLSSFYESGIANKNADSSSGANTQEFVAGTTPILIEGPYMLSQFDELGGAEFDEKFATAPLPKKKDSISFAGGANWSVFETSKNKDSAWKFVSWMTDPKTEISWFNFVGGLPSQQESWNDPSLTSNEKLKAFGTQLENTKTPPSSDQWTRLAKTGDGFIERITRGAEPVSSALEDLQTEADSIGTK